MATHGESAGLAGNMTDIPLCELDEPPSCEDMELSPVVQVKPRRTEADVCHGPASLNCAVSATASGWGHIRGAGHYPYVATSSGLT